MKFEQIKTRKQLLKEAGIPINFVEVTIIVKETKRKGDVGYEKKVGLVYKKIKANDSADEYFMSRIRKYGNLAKNSTFRIKNIRIVTPMGIGSYEE